LTVSSANLAAWFDGNDINGDGSTVPNNAAITTWKDKSGKGHDATGSGAFTMSNALNGLSTVDLRGQTSILFPLGMSATSYTIFTVQYGKSSSDYQRLLNSYPDQGLLYGFSVHNTSWITGYNDGISSNMNINTPATDLNKKWSLTDLIVSGNSKTATCSIDGTLQDNKYWGSMSAVSTLEIGSQRLHGANYWKGYVAEVIVYVGTISDSERLMVQGYLAHKWGIQNNLPVSHPYKSKSPFTADTGSAVIPLYYDYNNHNI